MAIRITKLLNVKMTFDTNLCFKLLGLFYGDYDGTRINRTNRLQSGMLYAYSGFWFLFVSANVLRYLILLFAPRRTVLEYYLCDYAQMMSNTGSYRWMMSCGNLLIVSFGFI